MYPVGFVTMASYLRRHGFRTRIVNLALLMMRDPGFQVEPFLRDLRSSLFGIDLHWLPHVQGSLEVARLVKRIHPEVPTVFGGISSTYFHEELIRRPEVDFVLRGSVCEPSILALLRELAGDRHFGLVPNLVWKQGDEVRINEALAPPRTLDEFDFDLGMMIRHVIEHADFWSSAPFHGWWRHPITAVFTVRGCGRACVTCGASAAAFGRFMIGAHPFYRSPAAIAAQVRQLAMLTRAPIFLVGDVLDGGADYAAAVVDALALSAVSNRIIFEFFAPPPAALIEHIDRSLPHWSAELSPDSHDPQVRAHMQKAEYTDAAMEASIAAMLAGRCEAVDLFFMVGLPHADLRQRHPERRLRRGSVRTLRPPSVGVHYADGAVSRSGKRCVRARRSARLSPLCDDLGRPRTAAAEPRLGADAELRDLLDDAPEMVDATYDAAECLTAAKLRTGRLSAAEGTRIADRIAAARALRQRLASIERCGAGRSKPRPC